MERKHGPAISVVVPIYNTEKYLPECVESILKQTFRDMEIVLVDDGSTDGSGRICDQYAAGDSRVIVVHQKQSGRVAARKAGLSRSTGAYISFVDSDDWIDSDLYSSLTQDMEQTGIQPDIVACGVQREFSGYADQKLNHLQSGLYENEALAAVYDRIFCDRFFEEWGLLPYLPGKLFSRELLFRSGFMETDNGIVRGEDCLGVFLAVLKAKTLLVCENTSYHYRQTNYAAFSPVGENISDANIKKLLQGFHRAAGGHPAEDRLAKQIQLVSWNYLLQTRHEQLQEEFPDFLVPYPEVPRGARIVLYGTGVYGKSIYHSLQKKPVCQVLGWVDRRWDDAGKRQMGVEPVERLLEMDFDYVVITILNERISEEAAAAVAGLGIERSKIAYIRAEAVQTLPVPQKFTED